MRELIPDTMLNAAVEGWEYERSEAQFRGFYFTTREGIRTALLCALGLLRIKPAGKPEPWPPEPQRIREIDAAVANLDALRTHLMLERYALSDALVARPVQPVK